MKYAKPEIVASGSAVSSIQSSNVVKKQQITLDSRRQLATTAAYEADE